MQINTWEKTSCTEKISLMTYDAGKNLIPLYLQRGLGKSSQTKSVKYHPYPTPPQTSNGHIYHLGGEGINGFDTLVNVIHQQNVWRAFIMWWFSRLKFCISRLKIRR